MAETAAQRFARDTGYKEVAGDANHESGVDRFARTEAAQPAERTDRRYVDGNGDSALTTYIGTL